ncbi:hypothetical protein BDU57DRAFT_183200 [Ampelomyces quisqualis]|uniref:Uncharacterized protein n=1 Tax=Ampelomyces quisqualis TaxID=50730 RepID=A0A6A5QTU5_AMPQU|nr:hypothetical protein BDU57DRAFT_183200 [Ampelomyces quisqualis]
MHICTPHDSWPAVRVEWAFSFAGRRLCPEFHQSSISESTHHALAISFFFVPAPITEPLLLVWDARHPRGALVSSLTPHSFPSGRCRRYPKPPVVVPRVQAFQPGVLRMRFHVAGRTTALNPLSYYLNIWLRSVLQLTPTPRPRPALSSVDLAKIYLSFHHICFTCALY